MSCGAAAVHGWRHVGPVTTEPFTCRTAPLPDWWLPALKSEAEAQRAVADPVLIEDFGLDVDGGVRGKRHIHAAGPGPELAKLHNSLALDLAEESVSPPLRPLFPTRCSYLYYEPGDYALLHQDVPQCVVTVLTALHGAEPLYCYPWFGASAETDLNVLDAAPFSDADSFETFVATTLGARRVQHSAVTITPGTMTALHGREVPHSRYPQQRSVTMVALCYAPFAAGLK